MGQICPTQPSYGPLFPRLILERVGLTHVLEDEDVISIVKK